MLTRIEFEALKKMKIMFGSVNFGFINTIKLAEMLATSQQSDSRILISLSNEGYITRKTESRKQRIVITEKGIEILRQELNELTSALNPVENIDVQGQVQSGLGEGRYYVSRKYYIVQFQEKLHFLPYLGTLNLRISDSDAEKIALLNNRSGIEIHGFKTEDRTFGGAKAFRCKVNNVDCAVLMPERSVHRDVLELISPYYLREKLSLKDGDEVKVQIYLKERN